MGLFYFHNAFLLVVGRFVHFKEYELLTNTRSKPPHPHPTSYPCPYIPYCLPTTVGSRSTKTARGTCLPAPVSEKKVLKESSPPPMVLSEGICPSGWIPCSKQYNSQQALPIWTPAWPTWMEIHSRWKGTRSLRVTMYRDVYVMLRISICNNYVKKDMWPNIQ